MRKRESSRRKKMSLKRSNNRINALNTRVVPRGGIRL